MPERPRPPTLSLPHEGRGDLGDAPPKSEPSSPATNAASAAAEGAAAANLSRHLRGRDGEGGGHGHPRRHQLADHLVRDLPDLLRPGDALVLNDTRVIMACLHGIRRRDDGAAAAIEVNLHQRIDAQRWRAFARPAKRLKQGDRIRFGEGNEACLLGALDATVEARDGGEVTLVFDVTGAIFDEFLAAVGSVPLPPYIAGRRSVDDADRVDYQTVFANTDGSVAAPTAGLHFTPELLARLAARGISRHFVTLHVGAGTFLPMKVDDTADHRMHAEWGEVGAETARQLNAVRAAGGRIVAVGTTSLRLLESAIAEDGTIGPFKAETAIFITPGYRFRAVDLLFTNFHSAAVDAVHAGRRLQWA